MLSTDTRFFGAEVVGRSGYVYTFVSAAFYHLITRILVCIVTKVPMFDLQT